MLVKDCMTRHPILVSPEMPAAEAQKIMSDNKVRHLPVVGDGKKLLGLVSPISFAIRPDSLGSLNFWEISRRLSNIKVKDVMLKQQEVITIDSDRTIERAAKTMRDNKSTYAVIIEDGVVCGILTETDLLHAFQQMLGLPSPGVRVTIRMPNRAGEFTSKLMATLTEQGWGVMGIGTFPSPKKEGYYDAVLKIPGVTVDEVKAKLSQIQDQEVIDIRDSV
ncbi:MAG: CBS domain-containing protein [Anaerolineales bacterium]|nr:CBS domain-containing protein [Anaerolineales bacterium]